MPTFADLPYFIESLVHDPVVMDYRDGLCLNVNLSGAESKEIQVQAGVLNLTDLPEGLGAGAIVELLERGGPGAMEVVDDQPGRVATLERASFGVGEMAEGVEVAAREVYGVEEGAKFEVSYLPLWPEATLPAQATRVAWVPYTIEGGAGLTGSKFGGRPWLDADEAWPTCGHCGEKMQHFLQLNLEELREPLGRDMGEGLIQLFYCTNESPRCEIEAHFGESFAEGKLARWRPSPQGPPNLEAEGPDESVPERGIAGWDPFEDEPVAGEFHDLEIPWEQDLREYGEYRAPLEGDKLGGWPLWIQSIDYPSCSICGTQMEMLLQVDSEDNLPWMFCDRGCGQLMVCPAHHDQVTFQWQTM